MAPLPVGQGSKEPARGGVLGVSSATSFFLEFPLVVVVVVVTTPHTDANSIQKDNHQLSTQFKKTKRGPAFRAK